MLSLGPEELSYSSHTARLGTGELKINLLAVVLCYTWEGLAGVGTVDCRYSNIALNSPIVKDD